MTDLNLYCPDCRGKFIVDDEDLIVDETVECDLCGTMIEIVDDQPLKIRIYNEDNYL
jgi:predicted Zn finger-like uncharacterized protein